MSNLDDIYNEVSMNLNIPKSLVKSVYSSYWLYIKNKINEMPLKDDLSKDDINEMKNSFSIPFFGKLYVDTDKAIRLKNKYNDKRKED